MIEYNKAQIGRIATKNGFVRDTFEKVATHSRDFSRELVATDVRD